MKVHFGKTALIMAGGTGGHIFPALAVAHELTRRHWRAVWVGQPESMEARLVPEHGFAFLPIVFPPLRGKGIARKLGLPLNLLRALSSARRILQEAEPDLVVGFGGYVSFPCGAMARLSGIPLVLHEQNAIAGLANRALAPLAKKVLTGFPEVFRQGRWVGNPVRPTIAALPDPETRFAGRQGRLRLLVLGGSLGAQALNEVVPKGIALMGEACRPHIRHQAGQKHLESLKANYAAAGVEAECLPFIDDMAEAYGWADLVICRAGALTLAELAAAGVASVLVPFPFAVDDHQTANARFLAQAGGAILLPQAELTPESIALIGKYPRRQLLEMGKKARELARPDAASAVADICAEVVA
ncbi:MAG: undecaprenyldiphospho-muramoylpentapeptide beta-N-acetylglucosaminyltransferase [Zoogloeaceae bacterium]|jgi:UDP-N-acetylglucosamine--N-acetylmuramyl-(pentapeptide) pyrophosphoryl-undecaprenol N-acetylglucosamine transferase|nr:undecaprenyldiphospho-muramoylpentapeptide beta-N-acetylglucosaminyltransferase [Zoogloeaceae bacterium]